MSDVSSKFFPILQRLLKPCTLSSVSTVNIFYKGLYVIFLLKLIITGSLIDEVVFYNILTSDHGIVEQSDSRDWDNLIMIARISFGIFVLILCFLKRTFWTSCLIFILYLAFYLLTHPIVNGGDIILLFYLGLGVIFHKPTININVKWEQIGDQWFEFVLLVAQIQLAIIYLHSGWDKLTSPDWRGGIALYNMISVDYYATPWLKNLIVTFGEQGRIILSWLVIGFELLFPILVWPKNTRIYVLIAGITFHMLIGLGLSIPIFSILMIWCLLLFHSNSDFISRFLMNYRAS